MKNITKLAHMTFASLSIMILASCAAGSATAGYSLRSQTADRLTAEGEQRIIDRTKKEIQAEQSARCFTSPTH